MKVAIRLDFLAYKTEVERPAIKKK